MISRETIKQHIKAAILMMAGALFAIMFASAEQDAGDANGWLNLLHF